MIEYRIWNKQDEIVEGVSADYIISSHQIKHSDEVFLIYENGNLTNIEISRIVKSVYSLDTNLTVEQVAQAYLDIRQSNEEKTHQDQMTLEQQANKISILTEENLKLKEVAKEQDKMIMDTVYKMTILEANTGGM